MIKRSTGRIQPSMGIGSTYRQECEPRSHSCNTGNGRPLVRRKSWQVAVILSRCETVCQNYIGFLYLSLCSDRLGPFQLKGTKKLPFLSSGWTLKYWQTAGGVLIHPHRSSASQLGHLPPRVPPVSKTYLPESLLCVADYQVEIALPFSQTLSLFPPESWHSDSHSASEWSMVGSL